MNTNREKFESWKSLLEDGDYDFTDELLYEAWKTAWQAATESLQQELADLRKQVAAEQAKRKLLEELIMVLRAWSYTAGDKEDNYREHPLFPLKNKSHSAGPLWGAINKALSQTSDHAAFDAAIAEAMVDASDYVRQNLQLYAGEDIADHLLQLAKQRKEKVK